MKTLIIALAAGLFTALTSYNSSLDTVDKATQQLDATQVQMLNSQIRMYMGDRVKGTAVTEFLMYVEVLNENDTFPEDIVIDCSTNILNSNYYKLESFDNNGDGCFDTVVITEN